MGLFSFLKVAGVTYDGARVSEPFHSLAMRIHGHKCTIQEPAPVAAAQAMLLLYQSHKNYFDKGIKSEKEDAIKFLVAYSSYRSALEFEEWNWERVRDYSRGLYGSMDETPAHFLHYNTPLIEQAVREVTHYLRVSSIAR